jgi:UDP-galactopyranose mutase
VSRKAYIFQKKRKEVIKMMLVKLEHRHCKAIRVVETDSVKKLFKEYDKKIWKVIEIEEL